MGLYSDHEVMVGDRVDVTHVMAVVVRNMRRLVELAYVVTPTGKCDMMDVRAVAGRIDREVVNGGRVVIASMVRAALMLVEEEQRGTDHEYIVASLEKSSACDRNFGVAVGFYRFASKAADSVQNSN